MVCFDWWSWCECRGVIIIYCSSTNQNELFLLELGTIVCPWAHHRKSLNILQNIDITTLHTNIFGSILHCHITLSNNNLKNTWFRLYKHITTMNIKVVVTINPTITYSLIRCVMHYVLVWFKFFIQQSRYTQA